MNNFQVRDEQAEEALRKIGEFLTELTPEGMGFAILLFDYGEGGNMFYAAKAKREDMIKAMKEFISKNEDETV